MKTILSRICTIFVCLLCPCLTWAQTLTAPSITLENGQITISSTSGATLWYNYGGGYPTCDAQYSQQADPDNDGKAEAQIDASTLTTNNQYLKVVCDGVLEPHENYHRQLVYNLGHNLDKEQSYVVSARIKASSNDANNTVQLWVGGKDTETASDYTFYGTNVRTINADWNVYTWTFKLSNDQNLPAMIEANRLIFVFGHLNGEICFDDVVLQHMNTYENLLGDPNDGNRTSHFYGGDYQYTDGNGNVTEGWSLVTDGRLAEKTSMTTEAYDCIVQAFVYQDNSHFSAMSTLVVTKDGIIDIDYSNPIEGNTCQGNVGSMTFSGTGFEIGYNNGTETLFPEALRIGNGTGTASIPDGSISGRDVVTISFDLWVGALTTKKVGFGAYTANGSRIGSCEFTKYNHEFIDSDFGNILDWVTAYGDQAHGGNGYIHSDGNRSTFTITLDYARNKMQLAVVNGDKGTHVSEEFTMKSNGIMKEFRVWSNYNNADRRCWFDNLLITKHTSNDIVTATYRIRYLDEEQNELKNAINCMGYVGQQIIFNPGECPQTIVKDEAYHYFKDSDIADKTIAADGSTVVTVNYRPEYEYSYTLTAFDEEGNRLSTQPLPSGQFKEHQLPYRVFYQKSVLSDGKYYAINRNNADPYYGIDITSAQPGANNFDITYTLCHNIAFYGEVEDMALPNRGWDKVVNAPQRYSKGTATRMNYGDHTHIDNLEAGVYSVTLYARNPDKNNDISGTGIRVCYTNERGTVSHDYGTFSTWRPAECSEHTISNIVVPAGYQLQLYEATDINNRLELDYIYITRTGEVQTLYSSDNLRGWKNFYDADNNWELDNATSIYYVENTEGDDVYTVTRIDNQKIIPADSPVLLRTTNDVDNAISMKQIAETTATVPAANKLQASTSAQSGMPIERTYRFGYVADYGIGFFTVSKVPANTPYLQTPEGSNAPTFRFAEEEETAIQCINTSNTNNNYSYNLQGQRVSTTQGITLHQGRIRILK